MDKVKKKILKNGMQLLLVPQEGAESMTLLVLVKVGSRYETEKTAGAAHFIEHMMFKGTEKRPNTQAISQELDRYGAEFNAYTGKDLTGYYIKMDAKHAETAVDMLHDMLFHSKFESHEMERERAVILEEIKMYEDNPSAHVSDMLEEALFHGSPLAHNIAGTRQTMGAMKRQDLINFLEQYYIPERITVVAAGKISPLGQKMVEKSFGRVPKVKQRKDQPFICFEMPKELKHPIALKNKKTEQTQLVMGFVGLPFGHADKSAVTLLSSMLGGTMSSRLFVEIRERRGLCYAIRASHDSLEDTGLFTIAAGLDKSRIKEAVKAIYSELNKIIDEQVKNDELKRAKDNIRGRMALAFEDSATRAEWYGRQWIFERGLKTPEQRLAEIDKVTAEDVRRTAREILNPNHMVVAAIGPVRSTESFKKIINWKK
jgi:predicted Zn-dependent peptidase